MKSTMKVLLCIIATVVLAFIGCLNDNNGIIFAVSIIASVVCGFLAVVFLNKSNGGDNK